MRGALIKTKLKEIDESIRLVGEHLPDTFEEFSSMGLIKDGIYKNRGVPGGLLGGCSLNMIAKEMLAKGKKMKILHIFDDYGTPGERALAGEGSVPTVVYYLSPRYVPVALRQVLRRHGLDEMRRLLYSAKVFLRYVRRGK